MKNWNPKLEVGDRVILYYMGDGHEVAPLSRGSVTQVQNNPFDDDDDENIIYYVRWDDGGFMSLISTVDYWIKEEVIESY